MGLSNSPTPEEFVAADQYDQLDWLEFVGNDYARLAGVQGAIMDPDLPMPHAEARAQALHSLGLHLIKVLPSTLPAAEALVKGIGYGDERLGAILALVEGPLAGYVAQARLVAQAVMAFVDEVERADAHRLAERRAAERDPRGVARQQYYLHREAVRESQFQRDHDPEHVKRALRGDLGEAPEEWRKGGA